MRSSDDVAVVGLGGIGSAAGADELVVEAEVERQCDVLTWIRGAGLAMRPGPARGPAARPPT
jgi:hypothetical protein